jgi:AcrR family transcriptional regulator
MTPPPPTRRLGQDGRPVRTLRRDATRNRERALSAAQALFAVRGADVTMEEIAAEAGIGKGTLYRGYPSRAALAQAILDERARELQADLLSGFGVRDRGPLAVLEEFVLRLRRFTEQNLDLFCISREAGPFREAPAYLWTRHAVAGLIRAAAHAGECRPVDLDLVPDALLALVGPDLIRHQRDAMGVDAGAAEGFLLAVLRAAVGAGAGSPLPDGRTPV